MDERRPQKEEVSRSGSLDLFGGQQGAAPVIPQMTAVPETREERWRRRILWASLIALVVASTAMGIFIYLHMRHTAAVVAATETALDNGREDPLAEALTLLESDDGDEDRALRAMLLGIKTYEHGNGDAAAAKTMLETLPGSTLTRAQIATIYVALFEKDHAKALEVASALTPQGEDAAEVAHARTEVALEVGSLEQALATARLAAEARANAPRHLSLLAIVLARSGDPAQAVQLLTAAPDDSPAIRTARARVYADVQHDYPRAAVEAEAVLGAQGATATPAEKAWARLVRARSKVATGDLRGAVEDARAARDARPPGQEAFGLLLAETFLRADDLADCNTELEAMAAQYSTDPGRRAQLKGEVALRRNNLDVAAAELARATPSPLTTLLRARLADMRGAYDEALTLYAQAAADPAFEREAKTRQAALELTRGRTRQASELIERALQVSPTDPETVFVGARVRLGLDHADDAMTLVNAALAAHPNDSLLLEARALVHAAAKRWAEARDALLGAIEGRPESADLRAQLGEALRMMGEGDAAKSAYEQALERDATHPKALVGLVLLALDAFDADRAREALTRVEAAGITSRDVYRAKVRLLVLTASGAAGLNEARTAMRETRNDAIVALALAELYRQADQSQSAANTYGRAIEDPETRPAALAGRALLQAERRLVGPAKSSIDLAQEEFAEHDPGPRIRARLLSAVARLAIEKNQSGPAQRAARRALDLDPDCAEAHLVLALITEARNRDPSTELEAAIAARIPDVDAFGRLAIVLFGNAGEGAAPPERACQLAQRYLQAAPTGEHAQPVREAARACPR